jgi:hypothetical protein
MAFLAFAILCGRTVMSPSVFRSRLLPTRVTRRTLGAVVSIAALAAGLSLRATAFGTFTPYVPQTPPQRAQGDFDGDGRVDTAFIEDRAGTARISVRLSRKS